MASYTLTVPGPLQPKERPRVTRNGHVYTPRATADQEYAIRRAWADQVGQVMSGPVILTLVVERARPATHWTTKGDFSAVAKRELAPAARPDLDNYLKVVLDGLNGVAWRDDSAICGIECFKVWSQTGVPSWTVVVEDFDYGSRGMERCRWLLSHAVPV